MISEIPAISRLALAWAVVSWPNAVWACSVCSAGRDEENQAAFLWSTLFMSVLPLLAIGGIVYFLSRRYREIEVAQEAKREASSQMTQADRGRTPVSRVPAIH